MSAPIRSPLALRILANADIIRLRLEQGVPNYAIAQMFGCNVSSLNDLKKRDPEIAELFADRIAPPRDVGKSCRELSVEEFEHIRVIVRRGGSNAEVAAYLQVAPSMLTRWKRRYPALARAMEKYTPEKHDPDPSTLGNPANPTPKLIKAIETWAFEGVSKRAMAAMLRVKWEDFDQALREQSVLSEAIAAGEARGEAEAAKELWTIIRDRTHKEHSRCVQFYLKQRGWKGGAEEAPKLGQKTTSAAPADVSSLSPEQILEALRKPAEPPPLRLVSNEE